MNDFAFNNTRSSLLNIIGALTIGLIFGTLTLSCGHKDGHDEHDHEATEHEAKAASGEIVIEPEEAAAIGIEVTKVQPRPFSTVIKVGGSIQPAAGDEFTISAPMSGRVRINSNYAEGSSVSAGTGVFTISAEGIEGGDVSRQAAIDVEAAKSEFQRVEKLYKAQLATEQEYLQAKREYEKSLAAADVYKGNTKGMSASSSITGYIKNIDVKNGEYVTVGQPLATVASDCNLFLRANVPSSDYKIIGSVCDANFILTYTQNTYSVSSLGGSVFARGRMTDATSGMIPVTFRINNVKDLISGSYAEVYLLGSPKENVITVPKSAVTENQGLYFVYVQKAGDDDCYLQREVKLGDFDGNDYEVISGLSAGENVVTKGSVRVKLAGAANTIPGHTHEH